MIAFKSPLKRMVTVTAGAVSALTVAWVPTIAAARVPIDALVGYGEIRNPVISKDGVHLAAIRRDSVGDVLILADLKTGDIKPVHVARADQNMQLGFVRFKGNGRLVFSFSQRVHVVPGSGGVKKTEIVEDGFINVGRVYSSNLDGSDLISLYDPSSQQGYPRTVSTRVVSLLEQSETDVLIVAPKAGGSELWKVNVRDGKREIVDRGQDNTFNWVVDSDGVPVLRQDVIAGGKGFMWSRRARGEQDWKEVVRFRGAEGANSGPTFVGEGPTDKPGQAFVLARKDGDDTSGLYRYDTNTGTYLETLQTVAGHDVTDSLINPYNNKLLAACWLAYRVACEPKDAAFGRQWTALNRALGDKVNVQLTSIGGADMDQWIVQTNGPKDLGTYYLFDLKAKRLEVLFQQRPNVAQADLPDEQVLEYTTSDGQKQWGYLWTPPGVTDIKNLPTVIVPHGGPEGRDIWGFDPMATTLASQGYAVFQPNFRGGGGFGRKFVEAGHGQWGERMQEDVADATRNLIAQGITDPKRVCVFGWSYGGYVAMTASFKNTDLFKCAVAGAGVSDLVEMQRWVRDGTTNKKEVISGGGSGAQSMTYKYWLQAIGDPEKVRDRLISNSAARNAASVGMPLLLIHGDKDQTVPIEQSQLMQRAMEKAGKPVRLLAVKDTDHYFTPMQGPSWKTILTEATAFIGQNIGPGVEPAK